MEVTLLLKFGQQLVEDSQFAGIDNQMLASGVRWSRFSTIKQIWMIATFTKLHNDVEKTDSISFTGRVDDVDVFNENLCVPEKSEMIEI